MNIADNPISKPYLGGIIVLLGSCANLPGNQDIRHLRLAPRYIIQIRPSIFKGVWRSCTLGRSTTALSKYFPKSTASYEISLMSSIKSVKDQAKF